MKAIITIFASLILAGAAFGQLEGNPDNWCRGGFFTREYSDFRIGTVTGAKTNRVYFYRDDSDDCPAGKNCSRKAYVVGGDKLLVSRSYKGFACSWYVAPNGRETVGWIPERSIKISQPNARPPLSKWLGSWKYSDSEISFTDNKLAAFLNITGDAFWKGLGDNIHVGELDGRSAPEGNLLEYSEGDDEYDCRVTMRLIGDYLVVADNLKCGGVNVTFSGVYRRAGPARQVK